GRLAARGHRIRLICSGWAGAEPETTLRGIKVRRVGGRHTFALLGRGAERRAAFQAISESTRDDLVARGVPAERIRVIHPGVDARRLTPAGPGGRAAVPTFLYVGRLKR